MCWIGFGHSLWSDQDSFAMPFPKREARRPSLDTWIQRTLLFWKGLAMLFFVLADLMDVFDEHGIILKILTVIFFQVIVTLAICWRIKAIKKWRSGPWDEKWPPGPWPPEEWFLGCPFGFDLSRCSFPGEISEMPIERWNLTPVKKMDKLNILETVSTPVPRWISTFSRGEAPAEKTHAAGRWTERNWHHHLQTNRSTKNVDSCKLWMIKEWRF